MGIWALPHIKMGVFLFHTVPQPIHDVPLHGRQIFDISLNFPAHVHSHLKHPSYVPVFWCPLQTPIVIYLPLLVISIRRWDIWEMLGLEGFDIIGGMDAVILRVCWLLWEQVLNERVCWLDFLPALHMFTSTCCDVTQIGLMPGAGAILWDLPHLHNYEWNKLLLHLVCNSNCKTWGHHNTITSISLFWNQTIYFWCVSSQVALSISSRAFKEINNTITTIPPVSA